MTFNSRNSYCLFEAFLPPSGARVEYCTIATYSVDLAALAEFAVALTGDAESIQKPSPVDIIRALDQLRERLVVLCQRGRITVPSASPSVAALFGRFIQQQNANERSGSWHPKIILAAYGPKDRHSKFEEWRLWLGSRNLTGSTDLDAGLMLIGNPTTEKLDAPVGLDQVLDTLLRDSRHSQGKRERLVDRLLRQVRWRPPPGTKLERLYFWPGQFSSKKSVVDFKALEATDATIVSPFANAEGMKILATALNAASNRTPSRYLLTTGTQLLDPALVSAVEASQFKSKVLPPPIIEFEGAGIPDKPTNASSARGLDGEPAIEETGLHAKLYLFRGRKGRKDTLFVGSANLTGRALGGRNCEVLAQLSVSPEISETLVNFVKSMDDPPKIVVDPLEQAARETMASLHADRNAIVAAIRPKLDVFPEGTAVLSGTLPLLQTKHAVLKVALLTRLQHSVVWSQGSSSVEIAHSLQDFDWTDSVAFELGIRNEEKLRTSWVQKVEVTGFTELKRRKCEGAAIAAYLGPDEIFDLVRAEVTELPGTHTRDWTDPLPPRSSSRGVSDKVPVSLEEMLAARLRNPTEITSEFGQRMLDRLANAKSTLAKTSPDQVETYRSVFESLEHVLSALIKAEGT